MTTLKLSLNWKLLDYILVTCPELCGRVKESNMIRRNALPTKFSLNVPVFLFDSRQEVLGLVC